MLPSVWSPGHLWRQTTAGFYEFGQGVLGKRAVAYVVPRGQLGRMPASVRDLPGVQAIEDSGHPNDFDVGTVVVYGPDVTGLALEPAVARTARKRSILARASDVDAYYCTDNRFCLYNNNGFWVLQNSNPDLYRIQFGPTYTGNGWYRLGDYGWNDDAASVRNRRDRDSLLNKNWPATNGPNDRYCSDSHSSDSSLDNNFGGVTPGDLTGGDYEASAVANTPDDIHC